MYNREQRTENSQREKGIENKEYRIEEQRLYHSEHNTEQRIQNSDREQKICKEERLENSEQILAGIKIR